MRFLYLNTENIYPQDRHLIDGLTELGHTVHEICEKGPGAFSVIKKSVEAETTPYEALIVGFTSPLFVIRTRLAYPRAKIFFNATLPQIEANIISRREYGFLFYKAIKSWLVDFLSFHLSSKVLLESQAQIAFVHRMFLVPKKKLVLSYSGLNEKEFFFDPSIQKNQQFTVLFRGRFLPESGILTVIRAAKILEDSGIQFLIIGHGFMYKEFNKLMNELLPKNIRHVHDRLDIDKLRNLMLSSHISLGQLADHPRLKRTLPCKLFESLALKIPYLTARNKAVLEILTEDKTCFAVKPGNEQDLAEKILFLKNNPDKLNQVGIAEYELFTNNLSSKTLSENVLKQCLN